MAASPGAAFRPELLQKFDDALAAHNRLGTDGPRMRRDESAIVVSTFCGDDVCQFEAASFILGAETTTEDDMQRLIGSMALFGTTALAGTCFSLQTQASLATAEGTIVELKHLGEFDSTQNASLRATLSQLTTGNKLLYEQYRTEREDHEAKIEALQASLDQGSVPAATGRLNFGLAPCTRLSAAAFSTHEASTAHAKREAALTADVGTRLRIGCGPFQVGRHSLSAPFSGACSICS